MSQENAARAAVAPAPQRCRQSAALDGLRRQDFIKINENGFGDRYNGIAHSSCYFEGRFLVGTSRCNLQMIAVNNPPSTRIYPVRCPRNVYDLDRRAQIWSYDVSVGQWRMVYRSPLIRAEDGTEIAQDIGYRAQAVFRGPGDLRPALYVCTWSSSKGVSPELLRSEDGVSFERLGSLGSGDRSANTFRTLVPFRNMLFTSPTGSTRGYGRASDMFAEATVYATRDPVTQAWTAASLPRFGDPDNLTVFEMVEFYDYLYAATVNARSGFQVWKTRAEGPFPLVWTKVIDQGAYRGNLNEVPPCMVVFGDALYVGSGIQNGGYDKIHKIGPAGGELIRIYPDDTWDIVIGDARRTPQGEKKPVADIGPGFDLIFNAHMWRGAAYNGWLYVGTYNWIGFLPYLSGERWPDRLKRRLATWGIDNLLRKRGGFDLWRSRDGKHWTSVTTTGFENPYNIGIRALVPTPAGLFVGTANHFGPEVAVQLLSGDWTYADNPSSGIEVWLGREGTGAALRRGQQEDAPQLQQQALELRTEYDVRMYEPLVEEHYESSGFYSWGYWDAETRSQMQACHNMMERLLSYIPRNEGRVLDVACGKGATTRHLLRYYRPENIVGIDISEKLMETCRRNAPGCTFRVMDATNLDFDDESFDNVVCVDGAALFDTREKFLGEAFRVLEPGAYLVLSDRLLAKDVLRRVSSITRENYVRNLHEYRELFARVGFVDMRIEDVTDQSLEGYSNSFSEFVSGKFLAGAIDAQIYNYFMAFILSRLSIIQHYVFVSARKPQRGQCENVIAEAGKRQEDARSSAPGGEDVR